MQTRPLNERPGAEVFRAFVEELTALLQADYTGNVTIRVQHGIIRNYRTEKVHLPGETLVAKE
jgi:hypothetical protein